MGISHSFHSFMQSTPEWPQSLLKGFLVGTIVPIVLNPLEKINTQIQVSPTNKLKVIKAIRVTPFKGVSVSIANGLSKNVCLFGFIPFFRKLTDSCIADAQFSKLTATICSAAAMSYVLSPLQVLKARLYTQEEKTIRAVLLSIPRGQKLSALFSGSSVTAFKYAAYWPTFFLVSETAQNHLEKHFSSSTHASTLAAACSGSLGGLAATSVSYPLDVIAKRQRCSTSRYTFYRIALNMIKQEGPSSLIRGLFQVNLPRLLLAGALTQTILYRVDLFFKQANEGVNE
ncbi:MC/SLC25 family protein [Candidatus Protochlamydia phocaeensis]|uniref:MC/SLC25 family protein n=1 Tax=Candidatus Protochlamydia phocaeensis TaxID=1414722 RepID=UPI0009AEE70F|nr:MC/SLC25 family protein [Candidatus Protochlamydia phocaeensis]